MRYVFNMKFFIAMSMVVFIFNEDFFYLHHEIIVSLNNIRYNKQVFGCSM